MRYHRKVHCYSFPLLTNLKQQFKNSGIVFLLATFTACGTHETQNPEQPSTEKSTTTLTTEITPIEQTTNIPTSPPTTQLLATTQPSIPIQEDCTGNHKRKTGVFVQTEIEFKCIFITNQFEIYYNPAPGIDLLMNNGTTDKEVVQQLAEQLKEAFETYTNMGLLQPETNEQNRISITLGGAKTPAQGYSRQKIIQLKPYSDPSQQYSDEFIYHEVFHQFQWAYTDDDSSYLLSQSFIESMADFATAKALERESPCLGDQPACLRSRQDLDGIPWGPSYDGEYWFEYLLQVEHKNEISVGELLEKIMTTYETQNQNESATVEKLYGEGVFERYRSWATEQQS